MKQVKRICIKLVKNMLNQIKARRSLRSQWIIPGKDLHKTKQCFPCSCSVVGQGVCYFIHMQWIKALFYLIWILYSKHDLSYAFYNVFFEVIHIHLWFISHCIHTGIFFMENKASAFLYVFTDFILFTV